MNPQLRAATLIRALFGDDPAALTRLLDQLNAEVGPEALDALLEGLFTIPPLTPARSPVSEEVNRLRLVACA